MATSRVGLHREAKAPTSGIILFALTGSLRSSQGKCLEAPKPKVSNYE
jgi:hypothetical protein